LNPALPSTNLTVKNSPLASTIIAPAASLVMAEFKTTNATLGALVTSIYLLGYAFGPLLLAPLSELYGRLILYNVCNVVFLVFNIACAKAPNMGGLITLRLFAGIAGS
jgi:MFS family permease